MKENFKYGSMKGTVGESPLFYSARNTNGEKVSMSVTLQRNYKDRNGSWKTTHSFRQNDLPKALLALQKAFEHMALARVS